MYYFEWLFWKAKLETENDRKNDKTTKTKQHTKRFLAYQGDEEKAEAASSLSISQTPKTRGPVYEYNENILEIRAGLMEHKRGLITLASLIPAMIITGSLGILMQLLPSLTDAIAQDQFPKIRFFNILIWLTILCTSSWLYFKYGLKITRLELFNSRHLLIRFDRKNQLVYLHRPSNCGGIVTLPWKGVTSSAACGDCTNTSLGLVWSERWTGLPYPEIAWVGKIARTHAQARDEWEFIRRFMDEGPEGLPRPRITSHFPWPWQAFTPQFEGLTPFSQCSWITRLGLLMIWPAFVIFGVCHWLSLLLCWKPRWPKVIREAGLPGKSVPPLSTLADRPLHIQERLLANAHLWAVIPGNRPEKKSRVRSVRNKISMLDNGCSAEKN